jgi:LAGLIDADG endonuclease
MRSDNSVGAEDQQERLITLGWVIGFVDGEGCFSVGFIRQPDRKGRRGYRTGYQVAHEFAVTQGESSLACLRDVQEFFGVGMLVPNRRYDDHREHLYRYVVRRRSDLLERIIPFFRRHPMPSVKQRN